MGQQRGGKGNYLFLFFQGRGGRVTTFLAEFFARTSHTGGVRLTERPVGERWPVGELRLIGGDCGGRTHIFILVFWGLHWGWDREGGRELPAGGATA